MRLASSMSRWFASRAHRSAMNRRLRAMEPMPAMEAFEPRLMLSSSPGPEAGQGGVVLVDDHGNDYPTSTNVVLPSMTAGLLEEASDEDWFTFFAYSHFTYTVDVSLGDLADSTVELVESATGEHLAENDDAGPGNFASHLEFTPEFGGDISAIVRSYGNAYTGTYTFSITETAPPDDHGNDALSATPMVVHSELGGTLENNADQDWFQVELVAGTTYRIQTVLDCRHYDLHDSVTYLYGSDGFTVLDANDDDPNGGVDSRLDFTPTVSGTHFLQVISYANSYIGSYLLAIEELPDDHGDLPGLATPMELGVQATGQFEDEFDVDVFSFQGEPGAIYELTGFSDNFPELDVYLYNAAGDPLAFLYFDSSPYSYFVQAPSDGLIVFDLSGYFYDGFNPAHMYALTITETEIVDDHANEPFNGTDFLPLPGSIPGDIQAVNDVDYFGFYAVADQAYTLRTILDTLGDSTLTLYDWDGVTELAFNDDYNELESQIDWLAPADGYYFLAVRGYDEEELGTYDLVIETGDSQPVDVVGAYMELFAPGTFAPGSLVDLRFDLYNYGPGVAANFYVTIYISRDGFINPLEDLPLSDFFVSESVFADDYSDEYLTVQLPDAFSGFWNDSGQYTLGLLIDPYGDLNETNAGNNSNTGYGYDTIAIDVGQIPADLIPHTIQSLDAGPFQPGDVFQATSIILNYSPNSSPATTIDYYLSQDGAIGDVGDVWIGSAPLPALGPYGSYSVTASLTLPPGIDPIWIGDGQYFIGSILDPGNLVPELNELNNANVGPGADSFPIQVQTPDTLPDLIGQTMAENSPVPLNPGQQTTLNLSVLNDGGAPAGASHFYIYLSANPQRTLYEGELLGVFELAELPAATTANAQVTVTMPEVGSYIYGAGAGTYYLHVVWDSNNAVSESIETNNLNRGLNIDSTPITVQLPDLAGYSLIIDNPAVAGGLLDLSFAVANLGSAVSTSFHTSVVLSVNDTIGDSDDRTLDILAFDGLAPLMGQGRVAQVLLPPAADPIWGGMTGFFYIGLVVDIYNQNSESNESNNFNQAIGTDVAPIQINELLLPDLTTTAMALVQNNGAGGSVALELTLENIGAGDSLNQYHFIYLSKDAVLDPTDYAIYSQYESPLVAGGSASRQITTYLPFATDPFWSGSGTYHLLSVSDHYSDNAESSEANNFDQGLGVDVIEIQVTNVEPSDLVASQLVIDTLPPYLPGGTVFYEFTMENLGAAPSGEFSVWVYISQDATIDFNDRYLAEFVMDSLDPLQSTSNSISFQLPSVVDSIWSGAGEYYIGLIVDPYDINLETDNANNLNQGLGVDIAAINVTFLRGDFDADGDVDLSDITLYQSYTRGGNPWSSIYELAGNPATLDQSDLDELIRVILGTQYGDADLNQQVSLGDLVLLAGNFNGPGGWGEGDFTGDGMVTLGDLVLLAENYGFDAMAPLTGVSLVALEGQGQADDEDDASAGLDLADILDEIAAGLRD